MSEYIPLEIQAEILKRLPLKPLIQFRSVSKPWMSLIDSPDFIDSYGVRHPHPDRFILRYLIPPSDAKTNPTFKYLSFVDNDDHSFVLEDFIPRIPDLIKTLETPSFVVGSSHGLLCVNGCIEDYSDGDDFSYKVTEMVILWNPSICKSVGVEVPYIYNFPNEYLWKYRVNNFIGFGVCPATFDPTILKIQYIEYGDYKRKMKDMPSVSVPMESASFYLSTGTWSILSTNLPRESISLRGPQVVIDRFIYWLALDAEDGGSQLHYLIMTFDLTAKVFKETNLTGSLTNQQCSIQTISKLRESLVLLEYQTEFEEDTSVCCCLWMMREEGDSRLFTKLYTINLPDATIHQILEFRKSGELIMETREE